MFINQKGDDTMNPYVCITGAAGGLGKAFAVDCASRGWDLYLTDISEPSLAVLAESLRNTYGVNIKYNQCDLTDFNSRTELFRKIEEQGLRFWFLINIAGLDYEGLFAERTREQITRMLRLNIEGNLEMTYSILKSKDNSRTFRVLNVCSLAAFYPMPVKAMYSSSKRFLFNFSMALREELRHMGGTVTALCPSGMPTTLECIRAIDAQGLAGRITTKNVGFVASRAVNHALKGHPIYIPGVLNKLLKYAGGLVPQTLTAHLIGNRWFASSCAMTNTR